MTRIRIANFVLLMLVGLAAKVDARLWTDSTGKYSIEADLVGFDDKMAILQRADHELGAVPIEKLSEKDREFLKSKDASDLREKMTGKMQTWTLKSGLKVPGKVVDFARKEITLQRRRGKIYVNDRLFDNLPEIYQRMMPQIVANFEPIKPLDKSGVEELLVRKKGNSVTYSVDGIILELENGDEYGVPFFFFSEGDLKVLQPGWESWLKAHEKEDESHNREQQAYMLQAAAAARHQDQQVQRQIAMMQLNVSAVQAGLTSLWEVTLYPGRPGVGPPMWVVMPGRNSLQATSEALAANPGYVAGPVRRVSN